MLVNGRRNRAARPLVPLASKDARDMDFYAEVQSRYVFGKQLIVAHRRTLISDTLGGSIRYCSNTGKRGDFETDFQEIAGYPQDVWGHETW